MEESIEPSRPTDYARLKHFKKKDAGDVNLKLLAGEGKRKPA